MSAEFELLTAIHNIERIAAGPGIREIRRLRRMYGGRRWRKLKGFASIRLFDGKIRNAELHWYEAHGIGRRELEIKRFLSDD